MANFLVVFFLGIFGVHRFMQKKYVTGFIWFFTFGLFGVGWMVDVCIAFYQMVKGGDKGGETGQANPAGAGQTGQVVQNQAGQSRQQAAGQVVQTQAGQRGQQAAGQMVQAQAAQRGQQTAGQRIQAGHSQTSGQTGDGRKKGFWAEMKEKAIKNRQEAAIRAAYKKEEEKRKPKIKKIRHTRPLTPQEQQTIDMIEMEMTKLRVDRESGRITNSAESRAWNSLWSQKNNIERRAEWYETIELPPEVDPDTPIYVDEEAIRNSITGLF